MTCSVVYGDGYTIANIPIQLCTPDIYVWLCIVLHHHILQYSVTYGIATIPYTTIEYTECSDSIQSVV